VGGNGAFVQRAFHQVYSGLGDGVRRGNVRGFKGEIKISLRFLVRFWAIAKK